MTTQDLKTTLKRQLLESGAVMTGSFTLRSGKTSSFYVNIKKASTDPAILANIAKAMAGLVKGEKRIAGMALGAVPLATAVALETMIPFVMIRKAEKGYGASKLIEGELGEGEEVLLIEDVATTGGSMIHAVEQLRAVGAVVKRALVVVDREEGAASLMEEAGVELVPLLRISEVLDNK